MTDDVLLVLSTAPDDTTAEMLARGLVEQRLAACVNLVPGVRSFYRWQGEIHDDPEIQLLIKSRRSRFDALEAWLAEHHPYDVPEIIALPVERGAQSYLAWVKAQTEGRDGVARPAGETGDPD